MKALIVIDQTKIKSVLVDYAFIGDTESQCSRYLQVTNWSDPILVEYGIIDELEGWFKCVKTEYYIPREACKTVMYL